jgi:hypothetical protein
MRLRQLVALTVGTVALIVIALPTASACPWGGGGYGGPAYGPAYAPAYAPAYGPAYYPGPQMSYGPPMYYGPAATADVARRHAPHRPGPPNAGSNRDGQR